MSAQTTIAQLRAENEALTVALTATLAEIEKSRGLTTTRQAIAKALREPANGSAPQSAAGFLAGMLAANKARRELEALPVEKRADKIEEVMRKAKS